MTEWHAQRRSEGTPSNKTPQGVLCLGSPARVSGRGLCAAHLGGRGKAQINLTALCADRIEVSRVAVLIAQQAGFNAELCCPLWSFQDGEATQTFPFLRFLRFGGGSGGSRTKLKGNVWGCRALQRAPEALPAEVGRKIRVQATTRSARAKWVRA